MGLLDNIQAMAGGASSGDHASVATELMNAVQQHPGHQRIAPRGGVARPAALSAEHRAVAVVPGPDQRLPDLPEHDRSGHRTEGL